MALGAALLAAAPACRPAAAPGPAREESQIEAALRDAEAAAAATTPAAVAPAPRPVAPPPDSQQRPARTEPPAASDPSDAPPPPLEDVVARVTPAIVLVETASGRGTAFFVTPDTLLTNVHVVRGSSSVTIRRSDGKTLPARVETQAPDYDIAVLKISNADRNQVTIPLGSALTTRVGREVIAIGSALGVLQNTVTRGIVSAMRQTGSAMLLQTDAAVNPGNSGGPLLDRSGTAIGITTMSVTDRQGLSFAVAIDHAQSVLNGRPTPASTSAASATAAASAAGDYKMLSPALMSDSDDKRAAGEKRLNASLAQLAQQADDLDDYWRRFRSACYSGQVVAGLDREWLALLGPRGVPGAVAPGCETSFADVKARAAAIRDGVIAADEAARRADVFPGTRRDARQRYRLASAGPE